MRTHGTLSRGLLSLCLLGALGVSGAASAANQRDADIKAIGKVIGRVIALDGGKKLPGTLAAIEAAKRVPRPPKDHWPYYRAPGTPRRFKFDSVSDLHAALFTNKGPIKASDKAPNLVEGSWTIGKKNGRLESVLSYIARDASSQELAAAIKPGARIGLRATETDDHELAISVYPLKSGAKPMHFNAGYESDDSLYVGGLNDNYVPAAHKAPFEAR